MIRFTCVPSRRKAVWGPKRTGWLLVAMFLGFAPGAVAEGPHQAVAQRGTPGQPNSQARRGKLDCELTARAALLPTETSDVIVTLQPGAQLPSGFSQYLKKQNSDLGIINGRILTVPNSVLVQLVADPSVFTVDYDRPIARANYRTGLTVGARPVHKGLGLTGAGVGVALIDSGITTWHDDLTNRSTDLYPFGNQRVSAFVDFVNGRTTPYDDDGHGTHVAGIVAGNGYDSHGQKAGIAPDASLVSLKVLDANGGGTISNVIAAFDWIVAHHDLYKIRVVNVSIAAAVHESFWTDPLTLAAKRVVDSGVVVVTAAGNLGKNAAGLPQYGGITAPGNAPWVLTVGASSTMGTVDRADDTVANFSSNGPTFKDWTAKPDLVAPGVGTVSLADPLSNYYTTKAPFLISGSIPTATMPYLALTGTSMSAPVVTGTVALMMQANPSLTPNLVKAILQYTAETRPGYNPLVQGAGFLNTLGAVRLAKFFATAQPTDTLHAQAMWSKHIIWGNHMLAGGVPRPTANAFGLGVNWGVAQTVDNQNIVWGTACSDVGCSNIVWGTDAPGQNIVWGTSCSDVGCSNIVWGTGTDANIVWGTDCGGGDCANIVWGTVDAQNIVWGTAQLGENILWASACDATTCADGNIVWGTAVDAQNIVWGTTADASNIVWGTDATDGNIVWGTAADGNIVWGTIENGNIVWGTGAVGTIQLVDWSWVLTYLTDAQVFEKLAAMAAAPVVPVTTTPPTTTPPTTTPPTTTTAPPATTTAPPPATTTAPPPAMTTAPPPDTTTAPPPTTTTAPPPADPTAASPPPPTGGGL